MKKKIFIPMFIFTCLLTACGKQEIVEQPQENKFEFIYASPEDIQVYRTQHPINIVEKEENIEESFINKDNEVINDNKKNEILEDNKEENNFETMESIFVDEILFIDDSYEIFNNHGVISIYDETEENGYVIICDDDTTRYLNGLCNQIKIKPILEDAGDALIEFQKSSEILITVIWEHQEEAEALLKTYGYDVNDTDVEVPQEELDKIIEDLGSLLSEEELKEIEDEAIEFYGDIKSYYLKSFELFDMENNSLGVSSFEELKEYYESIIQKFEVMLETFEKLTYNEEGILVSTLEEGKYYACNEQVDFINDSGKILKITKIEIEDNVELDINEEYCAQKTSYIAKNGILGYDAFYCNPWEGQSILFYFEFIEDEAQIKKILEKDYLFDGFCISTIPENEIQDFGGLGNFRLFNDTGEEIELIGKGNIVGELETSWSLQPGEVVDLRSSDFSKGYWKYK